MDWWIYYLGIGFLFCGLFVLADLVSQRRNSRPKRGSRRTKKLPKPYDSPSAVLSTILVSVFLWPLVLLILIWDAKARKDGAPFGLGGGGYINPKRSWRKYIADTLKGRRPDDYG